MTANPETTSRPRVGLVLGGGGVMGGAWLVGALDALAATTGWDPAAADVIVGTSAGSMIGSLVAAGVPPWVMVATAAGHLETVLGHLEQDAPDVIPDDVDIRAQTGAERVGGAVFRVSRATPLLGPASLRLALDALTRRTRTTTTAGVTAWLPAGPISTRPLKDTVRRVVPSGWGPHPGLWVVACDLSTGRRTVFGREDAPDCDLADAVAASCSIPGFYRPVRIGSRRYVDGGVWSASNLDVVARRDLDLVICLNPLSSTRDARGSGPAEPVWRQVRRTLHKRLKQEADRLRARGTEVVLVEPTTADLEAMGPNLMRRRGRNRVIRTAAEGVRARLADPGLGGRLEGLPRGAPDRIAPREEWRVGA